MSRTKLMSIQALRAIAFVLVFLSHAEILGSGPAGVSLFLVLSGFCMMYAYFDRPERIPKADFGNSFRFAVSRIKKLYPLHVMTLFFVALVTATQLIRSGVMIWDAVESVFYFVMNLLLVQSWIPLRNGYYSFNAVSWYLSTVLFCYCMFPYIYQKLRMWKGKKVMTSGIVVLCAMVLISGVFGLGRRMGRLSDDFVKWGTYICPLYRLGDFFIGAIAGVSFFHIETSNHVSVYSVIEVILLLLLAVGIAIYDQGLRTPNWMFTLFWLPVSVLMVYVFARSKGVVSCMLSKSKVLAYIADKSAQAFLIHMIVIKAVQMVISNKVMIALVAFTLTMLGVYLWKLVLNGVVRRFIKDRAIE